MKTDKESMDTFINFIKSIMNSRISKMKQEPFDLDVKRFFIDEEYAEEVIDTYDEIKKCINIFDVFKKLPQYKAIGELFAITTSPNEDCNKNPPVIGLLLISG